MKTNIYYETVSEATNELAKRGYTVDFEIWKEKECLVCNQTSEQLSPEEFQIDETYRFEGNTDPGDAMIVYAISSKKYSIKGIVVNAYGMYSDTATSKIVERLQNHTTPKKPIKRSAFLISISREHHHALLLCWKIRTGLKKQIEHERIKKYADWFYKNHLQPHFEIEEKYIFPILGMDNELIMKAVAEHCKLRELFKSPEEILNNLSLIADELESHIRFEERILFNEIQSIATGAQLKQIGISHTESKFSDNLTDPFWM